MSVLLRRGLPRVVALSVMALLLGVMAFPAEGVPTGRPSIGAGADRKLSQSVAVRQWLADPSQAPSGLQQRMREFRSAPQASPSSSGGSVGALVRDVFNKDNVGLPQNEESVAVCRSNPRLVLGGTNDYRGLLDPLQNFTGWHFSTNGGSSVTNEGLLPPLEIGGQKIPSGGDPVIGVDRQCNFYGGGLNYDPNDFTPNGIGLYKTTPRTLASCPGGAAPSCWPKRTVVATASDPKHFLDKPWFYVGESGGKTVVWIVYSNFDCPNVGCTGLYNSNEIDAVRCDADLSNCTEPINISGAQNSIQFGDVTIASDGSTYITWEQDNDIDANFEPPENMRFWLRVAPPGSTRFGPPRLVAKEPLNIGLAVLHANDFRAATYPKNEVADVNGRPRVFVTWDGCRVRVLDTVCEEPAIKLRYSDDEGKTWSGIKTVSAGGDNYFPTISYDRATKKLAVSWYTNRFDPIFHNRQDVELATVSPQSGGVTKRQRLTSVSNETEADPLLGGFFIGDYFEVFAHKGTAYVHYNANYRSVRLLGQGVAIPQQDNYLTKARL